MTRKFSLFASAVFVTLLLHSCFPLSLYYAPWSLIDKAWIPTHFDDSTDMNLSQRIRIDGYYMKPSDTLFSESVISRYGKFNLSVKWGALNNNMLLYEDGTVSSFIFKENNLIEQTDIDIKNAILCEDSIWGYGGRYMLDKDTLKVFTAWTFYRAWGYVLLEEKYEILDSCTLKHFETRERMKGRDGDLRYRYDYIYKFYPAYNLPNPDYIISKSAKQFWRDKANWKAYKQRMKQKRKEMK